jgi:foldase protein PrsA
MAKETTPAPIAPAPKLRRRLPLGRVNRTNWWKYLLAAIIGAYLVLLAVFSIGIYRGGWSGETTRAVSSIVPFPAGWVKGQPVFYKTFLEDVDSIKHYYASAQKVDFNSKDGQTRLSFIKGQVWNQQVENRLVSSEASRRKIKVSEADVQGEYKKIADANGGEAKVKDILKKYYDWDIPEFKKRIHEQLLRQKVQTAIQSDTSIDAQAKKRAEDIKKELKADGSNFADLAKKHSEDTSASQGGDLGFAGKGKYVPEFEAAAFTLQVNQISDPVKTQYGYHIIQMVEKKGEEVRVRHILIKTKDFQTWLDDQKKNIKPWIKVPATA